MQGLALTELEAEQLVDELSAALDEMVATSCPSMAPLWLEATREGRSMLGARAVPSLGFEPSPALLRLGKSSHSKYRGLAAWRHAALWQRALGAVEDAEFLAALRCVYFTPCADAPPFSWSRAAGRAPGVDRFSGPAELKRWAAEGAYCVLKALRELGSGLRRGRTWDEEVRAMLLRPAIRRTLEDVLKLEEFSR